MPEIRLPINSLVLYKQAPARVAESGVKKISLQTENGSVSVRPKDVMLLHPGPLRSLGELPAPSDEPDDEVMTAWELLAGDETTLSDLSDLAYDEFTPVTAWAIWQLVMDSPYFQGSSPRAIAVQTAESVAEEARARAAKIAQAEAEAAFYQRLERGEIMPGDEAQLSDVVALALRQRDDSRTLRTLARPETAQSAHTLLLQIGLWDEFVNPYPARFGAPTDQPELSLPDLPEEDRLDLTHLPAFAIDDEGNQDPDDAISWEPGSEDDRQRLWVHVADVAALAPPDSPADLEARARGANLYLPEGTVHMLPEAATHALGLGLNEISPALSFGMDVDADGAVTDVEIAPSWVRVTRLSYAEANTRLEESPLRELRELLDRCGDRRRANNAVELSFPEGKVKVEDGVVTLTPIERTFSRELVREAMLMAGGAVAHFALEHEIPVPFTVQEPPAVDDPADLQGETMAEMFAVRKLMRPGRQVSEPGPHSGLGLDAYIQVTSPLRRYHDLLTHQQLRAYLRGEPMLDETTVMERTASAREAVRSVRKTERLSVTHWRMVYLMQHPDWQGEGIVVDKRRARNTVIIPELALEVYTYGNNNYGPDDTVRLALTNIDLAEPEAKFRYL